MAEVFNDKRRWPIVGCSGIGFSAKSSDHFSNMLLLHMNVSLVARSVSEELHCMNFYEVSSQSPYKVSKFQSFAEI